ncbi:MAG: hypothetical protein RLZZ375_2135 [Pseudomonadota bacterium]|jgi:hypothetical protein
MIYRLANTWGNFPHLFSQQKQIGDRNTSKHFDAVIIRIT